MKPLGDVRECWGRFPRATQRVRPVMRRGPIAVLDAPLLPYGRGRSYGDVCLNDGGWLLETRALDHFLAFDETQGILTCEAGITLASILDTVVPRGWFLPVVPGTEQITVGGAIANDIHGKNHHRDSCFGGHVVSLELARSDGSIRSCSLDQETDLFCATIGGLGLTGLILSATIRLRRVPSAWVDVESIKFETLDEFFAIAAASERDWQYTVAWGDWRAKSDAPGRGIFLRGNHAPAPPPGQDRCPARKTTIRVPAGMPGWLLNDASSRIFNSFHFHGQPQREKRITQDYRSYFFPLDSVEQWNRLYGKAGFLQYQCVLPCDDLTASRAVMQEVLESTTGSYLTVLKTFGDSVSPGMLSFPRRGVTFALDFPNTGEPTFALGDRLDALVRAAGGAVYPAKDARMSPASFNAFFPQWREFAKNVDPAFSSSFWRRVTREVK